MIPLGDRSIGLGHAVNMHRMEVQVGHLFEEVRRGWASCHGNTNWLGKPFGFFCIA
jgi:hypothetical protein